MDSKNIDCPIPFALTDVPVPYCVRVETASPALRAFVVPRLGVRASAPPAPESGARLRVA